MHQDGLPRKVAVGTCSMLAEKVYAGLDARLEKLVALVDEMAAMADAAGRPLDVACLPEDANTAGWQGDLQRRAEDLPAGPDGAAGPTIARLAEAARRHRCYVIIPHFVRTGGRTYNSAVLLDRQGGIVGRYDKLHGIEEPEGSGRVERCSTPGRDAPVWDLDFGRVGVQICFDLLYDDGWESLEEKGAEIVFWPSAYPGVRHLGYRAWRHGYYVVSSPWRPPCGVYDPTGHPMALGEKNGRQPLVSVLDLEYRLMPWRAAKDRGAALRKKYGDSVGIFYREQEDIWLLWSNSDKCPVDRILAAENLEPLRPYLERMRRLQDAVRGGPPLA